MLRGEGDGVTTKIVSVLSTSRPRLAQEVNETCVPGEVSGTDVIVKIKQIIDSRCYFCKIRER